MTRAILLELQARNQTASILRDHSDSSNFKQVVQDLCSVADWRWTTIGRRDTASKVSELINSVLDVVKKETELRLASRYSNCATFPVVELRAPV